MNIFRNNIQARRGFTLVELVLILTIIGILLAIVVLPATTYVERSKHDADADRLDSFLQKSVAHAVLRGCTVKVVLSLDSGVYEAYEVYDNKDDIFGQSADSTAGTAGGAAGSAAVAAVGGGVAGGLVEQAGQSDEKTELIFTGEPLRLFFIDGITLEGQSESSDGEVVIRADGGGWCESFIISLLSEDENHSRWLACDRGTVGSRTYTIPTELPEPRANLN